jgi:hypothetical protein
MEGQMPDTIYSADPYRSETRDEARARRIDDFNAAAEDAHRAAALAAASAAQLRDMLTEHAMEEPAVTRPRDWPDFAARAELKRQEARHAAWLAELDTLARAYVAALDREAAQLPLPIRGGV